MIITDMPLCIATGIEVSVDDPVHNRQIDTLIIHIPLCDATGIKESVDDPVHNHHIDTPSLPSTSRQNLGSNCTEDLDAVLASGTSENFDTLINYTAFNVFEAPKYFINSHDHQALSLPEQNAITYISEYFLRKCFLKHHCANCSNAYSANDQELSNTNLLSYFRAYENENQFGNLTMPSEVFINYINNLEILFCTTFPNYLFKVMLVICYNNCKLYHFLLHAHILNMII
ncbi:hypothetical protein FQA39_LY06597 [Lamprigera yunnana]|nr:hypothetical protein FQA39_LY06597 [Lamprigera yunnana]